MINQDYWKNYYLFWDDFVRRWYESSAKPSDDITRGFVEAAKNKKKKDDEIRKRDGTEINLDELPEPYLGFPHEGVKAVFINLNPGMSQKGKYGKYKGEDLEETKFYSNRNSNKGWLIKEYIIQAGCSYKKFLEKWSALDPELNGHEPEVCGVEWWKDRMNWVRRIYNNADLCSSKVFAPELCPYHSKGWKIGNLKKPDFINFAMQNVLSPAVKAVKENGLPFAIAIGSDIRKILDAFDNAKMEKEWSCVGRGNRILSDKALMEIWPRKSDSCFVIRTYRLYTVTLDYNVKGRVLVSCASGGNRAPSEEFKKVEEKIREYVSANPL